MKKCRINLLPKSYLREIRIKKYLMLASIGLIAECILFMMLFIYPSKMALKHSVEGLDIVSEGLENESLSEVNRMAKQLENTKEEVEEWQEKYKKLQEDQWIGKSLLDSLVGRVPIGIHINHMKLIAKQKENDDDHLIELEGNMDDMTQLLNYIMVLEGVFGVQQVSYEVQYKGERELYEYSMKIEMTKAEETLFYNEAIEGRELLEE